MVPEPSFDHVLRLSDERGIFEHAAGSTPRRELGYCLDDVARGLVVVCRQRGPTPEVESLVARYLRFVLSAQAPDGRCHNRLDRYGRWVDQPGVGDWWGRALWGLGTAAARGPRRPIRESAAAHFDVGAAQRSPYPHSMAFAALGAAEMLAADPHHRPALELLAATAALIGRPNAGQAWPWPLPRLTYANAAIAEALIVAGRWLNDDGILTDGLSLLRWLLDVETTDGHLSVTPTAGRGPGEPQPAYDQQPIEAAALADACARAFDLTGDHRWAAGLDRAIGWFLGRNDCGLPLRDETTGGGFDALTPQGRNINQGAESTLALVSTLQHPIRSGRPAVGRPFRSA